MRIAYLILARKSPIQLKRLVNRLYSENAWIFIHLDNKVPNVQEFIDVISGMPNSRFIQRRVDIKWGAFSMVQATLNGLKEILDAGVQFDYINLMSGQDYPIKSNRNITEFITQNYGCEFIHYRQFPEDNIPQHLMERIEYYFDFDNIHSAFGSAECNIYQLEMQKAGIKRGFIQGMRSYHGSQWWSLTVGCVKYILDLVSQNKEIINFYRYTKYPDEQFFQTIVMNSWFSKNVPNWNLWYLDWSGEWCRKVNQPYDFMHPKTLDINDFSALAGSNMLFARKFDVEVDEKILDMIDTLL